MVLAGAGTGKTRVITHRVAALLDEGVPAWRILAVTFTNRAAGEMRERIVKLCEDNHPVNELWVGTFHSICARILRRHGDLIGLTPRFSIYDTGDQATLMGRILKEMNISDRMYTPKGILGHIDRAKNQGIGPDRPDKLPAREPVLSVVAEAYKRYQERLLAEDAVDFGDLLVHTVKLLRDAPKQGEGRQLADFDPAARMLTRFKHVVVDEYQDTNPIQAELVNLLSGRGELCVVGDDDQSIYGWRGADVSQILDFCDIHAGAKLVRLEQNYRSTTAILRAADAVIRKNRDRLGKTLFSDLGEGTPLRVLLLDDEREEARFVAHEIQDMIDEGEASPQDFAIFYRAHAQSRVIEDEIRRMGMRCRILGGVAFYERQEVKDLLSYLTVLENPRSDAHLLRIINRPTRGIGATSVSRLQDHARAQGLPLYDVLADPAAAGLGKAAARKVAGFRLLMEGLREKMGTLPLDELAAEALEVTGYRETLAADDSEESMARLENLQELLGNMREYLEDQPGGGLVEYLELVNLVGREDGDGERGGAITLMTIHSAKGLEFPNVYVVGMEEGVFPHARVLDDPTSLEEERRLAYVAITRAQRRLTLTLARRRRLYGQLQVGTPSRFVLDLPSEGVERIGLARPTTMNRVANPRPAAPVPEPEWDDDIVYEDGASASSGSSDEGVALYVGMNVRHGKYGEGELLGWTGGGNDLRLQLRFPQHGTKTILARYCEPA